MENKLFKRIENYGNVSYVETQDKQPTDELKYFNIESVQSEDVVLSAYDNEYNYLTATVKEGTNEQKFVVIVIENQTFEISNTTSGSVLYINGVETDWDSTDTNNVYEIQESDFIDNTVTILVETTG